MFGMATRWGKKLAVIKRDKTRLIIQIRIMIFSLMISSLFCFSVDHAGEFRILPGPKKCEYISSIHPFYNASSSLPIPHSFVLSVPYAQSTPAAFTTGCRADTEGSQSRI